MNKLWAIIALAMATNYSLAAANKKPAEPKPFEGKPAVALQVFDISTKVARPIQGTTMSISKKQNQLCWSSINMPLQNQKVKIVEVFYAPGIIKLDSPGSRINSAEDKKSHIIETEINNMSQQNINRCWAVDHRDPIGKYRLDIQINDYSFKGLEFEIAK
ncbi:hypothetical protein [Mannheimia indoligenes]|uniref:hypothetical protein n=1 Tax=Mannheimia indoligenes TaxID=3103145 RepID=UPI002FE5D2DC